jgi:hypothetical protein
MKARPRCHHCPKVGSLAFVPDAEKPLLQRVLLSLPFCLATLCLLRLCLKTTFWHAIDCVQRLHVPIRDSPTLIFQFLTICLVTF